MTPIWNFIVTDPPNIDVRLLYIIWNGITYFINYDNVTSLIPMM